jgi:hypothetical protein
VVARPAQLFDGKEVTKRGKLIRRPKPNRNHEAADTRIGYKYLLLSILENYF